MDHLKNVLPCYHEAEDGDMISFGPNCAFSVDKVRDMVKDSGPIVRKAFEKWMADLRDFARGAKA